MTCDYVMDGYTRSGFIAAVRGLHGDLRFRYRPFLAEDDLVLAAAAKKVDDTKAHRNYASAVAARVVEWSLSDAVGKPVPVSVDAVLRLTIPLWYKLKAIMLGIEPSDDDPQASQAERQRDADDAVAAVIAGATVGQIVEAKDEKN